MRYQPHQFKFTVGWDKADGPIGVKFIQPHALVKATVIQFYGVADPSLVLVDDKFVV